MRKGQKMSPEQRARLSEAMKKSRADPVVRARLSEAAKKAWLDSTVRDKMLVASKIRFSDPKERAKMSESAKKRWKDPAVRAKKSEAMKKTLSDPAVRAKISEAVKKAMSDPAVRAKMSEVRKKSHADPVVRAKISEAVKNALASPEARIRISESQRGKKRPLSFVEKVVATKRRNGTFNTSKPEEKCAELLAAKGVAFERNCRKDKRYPFCVDFYLPETDTFIECNFHWTHGKHPFDSNNFEDIALLNEWRHNKASKFYRNAAEVWGVRDPKKRETAKQNNLNFLEFFKFSEFENWLKTRHK